VSTTAGCCRIAWRSERPSLVAHNEVIIESWNVCSNAWFPSVHNATQRTEISPACRRDLRKNRQYGSSCVRNAGGTPLAAASSCVTVFFRDVFRRTENTERLCVALRNLYVLMETTRETCRSAVIHGARKLPYVPVR